MKPPTTRRRRPWRLGCHCWWHVLLLPQRGLPLVPSSTISRYERHHYRPIASASASAVSASVLIQQQRHKLDRRDTSQLSLASSSSSSSSSSQQNRSSTSPWSPGKWKMTLVFGNDNPHLLNNPGGEWGCGGGKLALSFEVFVTSETNAIDNNKQQAWLGGKSMGTLKCIARRRTNDDGDVDDDEQYCTSYINEKGQQNVQISSGQWRIEPPLPLLPTYSKILSGQASTLQFYLTLDTTITRNTICFPENQLLLLQSNAFRTDQYVNGIKSLLPYQYAKDNAQLLLDNQLNHETGDRRLDGSDVFETLGGYRDIAKLVLERDKKRKRWGEVERVLPKLNINTSRGEVDINNLMDDDNRWGKWPGDTEPITIERGVMFAVVVRERQQSLGLFPWMKTDGVEDLVEVGKWSVVPLFD